MLKSTHSRLILQASSPTLSTERPSSVLLTTDPQSHYSLYCLNNGQILFSRTVLAAHAHRSRSTVFGEPERRRERRRRPSTCSCALSVPSTRNERSKACFATIDIFAVDKLHCMNRLQMHSVLAARESYWHSMASRTQLNHLQCSVRFAS